MNEKLVTNVRLSMQRALLGAVNPALRSVTFGGNNSEIQIIAYFEGDISEEDEEIMRIAHIELSVDIDDDPNTMTSTTWKCCRCDPPNKPPCLEYIVYSRNEIRI